MPVPFADVGKAMFIWDCCRILNISLSGSEFAEIGNTKYTENHRKTQPFLWQSLVKKPGTIYNSRETRNLQYFSGFYFSAGHA
jgi:hypothetical protein